MIIFITDKVCMRNWLRVSFDSVEDDKGIEMTTGQWCFGCGRFVSIQFQLRIGFTAMER